MSLKTTNVHDLLAKRYPSPEFALMFEVAPRTGGGSRYADAVAVGLWQSRGHVVHGFEIKVSRSDWLRELKKPEKAEESVFGYCDFWWIVAPADIINDGELPPTWGLLDVQANRLVQKVAAPRLTPKPITRPFFASLMRRGLEGLNATAERMQRQQIEAAHAQIDERVRTLVDQRTHRFESLAEKVKEFEKTTGLKFNEFAAPPAQIINLARRLEALNHYRANAPLDSLAHLASQLEKSAAELRAAIDQTELRTAQPGGAA